MSDRYQKFVINLILQENISLNKLILYIKKLENLNYFVKFYDKKHSLYGYFSPLVVSLKIRRFDIALILLDHGADPNLFYNDDKIAKNKVYHPLFYVKDNLFLFDKFLEKGADPFYDNKYIVGQKLNSLYEEIEHEIDLRKKIVTGGMYHFRHFSNEKIFDLYKKTKDQIFLCLKYNHFKFNNKITKEFKNNILNDLSLI